MSKQLVAHPDRYLETNQTVSISFAMPGAELTATIIKITPDQIWLELAGAQSRRPIRQGGSVRVKRLDEVAVHYFDAKVLQVWGPDDRYVAVGKPNVGVLLERRIAFRARVPIAVTFTVISASKKDLVGSKRTDARTEDISVGGLKFETDLTLSVGDELDLSLQLPNSRFVNAVGWVVRSEPVAASERNVIAVRFFQLEADEQRQLLSFLAASRKDRQ